MEAFLKVGIGFIIGVVSLVIGVVLLNSLLTQNTVSCTTSGYVVNESSGLCQSPSNVSLSESFTTAGNVTQDGLVFADNFSSQWGLAGTILGFVLILGIIALIGYGGYRTYRGMR